MTPKVMEQTETDIDRPIFDEPEAESPIHLARCAECASAVRYTPNASGAGFIVEDAGDLTFGVGPNGRPTCPNGHGEMAIADDQMPAHDAISDVARMQEAQQAALPGILPPFNYQGAYLALEDKAVEVDRLKHEWEADKEAAAGSKKAWEKAADVYTKMAIENRRHRREKVAAGEPVAAVDPNRCAYEQANPDARCPICTDDDLKPVAARDSSAHVDEVAALLTLRDVNATLDALIDIDIIVSDAACAAWSPEDRAVVRAWAKATLADNHVDPLPPRPTVLGTMHVASVASDGDQTCTQCDTVLVAADQDANFYDAGTLVGTDCPGKPKAEPHRYTKRKPAAKKGKK